MNFRTNEQSIRLHTILGKLGVDKETKETMVYEATAERTNKSSAMYVHECDGLINALQNKLNEATKYPSNLPSREAKATLIHKQKMDKMRKAILSMCYQMLWTDNDGVDYDRLDAFLLKSGVVKKKLNDLSLLDLTKAVTQFQTILKKEFTPPTSPQGRLAKRDKI